MTLISYDAAKLAQIIDICWFTHVVKDIVNPTQFDKTIEGREQWIVRKYIIEKAYSKIIETEKVNEVLEKERCFLLKQLYIKNAHLILENPTELNKLEYAQLELEKKETVILDKPVSVGNIWLSKEELDNMISFWFPTNTKGAKNERIYIKYFYEDNYILKRAIIIENQQPKIEQLLAPSEIQYDSEVKEL